MTTSRGPERVLAQVGSRLRWAGFGRRLSALVLWTSVAAAAVVLFVRLTGLVDLPIDPMVMSAAGLLGIETTGIGDPAAPQGEPFQIRESREVDQPRVGDPPAS